MGPPPKPPSNIPSSVPRLNTQPVPPTPLTSGQTISAPANQTEFCSKILSDQPNVSSPFNPEFPFPPPTSSSNLDEFKFGSQAQPTTQTSNSSDFPPLSSSYQGGESPSPRSVLLSPSKSSPTSRPLSPDLPTRDALYLFSNFSSYMRSPNEGSQGVKADDFKHTIRLLEHARWLSSQPHSNVHILHLKYRFQGQSTNLSFRTPYSTGDYQLPLNVKDSTGKIKNPVPQPFSVLHDPVVKIDYMENGVFEPLPAQAVFSHIAKMCQPPPRIIVISYVFSKVIENHLSSLSTWALTSSPPSYIFSPLETRLRESQPLHIALGNSIPISMYAWPNEVYSSSSGTVGISNLSPFPSSYPPSTSTSITSNLLNNNNNNNNKSNFNLNPFSPITIKSSNKSISPRKSVLNPPPRKKRFSENSNSTFKIDNEGGEEQEEGEKEENDDFVKSPILITRRISGTQTPDEIIDKYYARRTSQSQSQSQISTNLPNSNLNSRYNNRNDPIASLTVITSSPPSLNPGIIKLSLPKSKSNIDLTSTNKIKSPIFPNDIRRTSIVSLTKQSQTSSTSQQQQPQQPPPIDRIPLWHLAPGVGILHGSTSASIGIKLSDFSAINLIGENGKIDSDQAKKKLSKNEVEELGIKTDPINLKGLTTNLNPNPMSSSSNPSFVLEKKDESNLNDSITISRPSSTTPLPLPVGIPKQSQIEFPNQDDNKSTHLTPPNPNSLSRQKPFNSNNSQSWPAPISRIPGWRKGRKELMEDTLDELGLGFSVDLVDQEVEADQLIRSVGKLGLDNDGETEEEEGAEKFSKELIGFLIDQDIGR